MYVKRDLFNSKETLKRDVLKNSPALRVHVYVKSPMYIKRDLCISKETLKTLCMSKETYVIQKRPM